MSNTEMKMSERVTWLLSARNGMPFLTETLASIEAQTYRNWEILAWDAESNDGTLEELRKWIPSRLPGRIISNRPLRLGPSLAAMVQMASTELCARIDADDVALPNRLAVQVHFMRGHPEIAVLGSQMELIDVDGNSLRETSSYPCEHEEIVVQMIVRNPIGHPSVIFRKKAILDSGNYLPNVEIEDYELWLRVAYKHRLANLPEILTRYRIHDRSSTREIIRTNRLKSQMDTIFIGHSATLFGLKPAEAKRLCDHNDRFILARAVKIARHVSVAGNISFWDRLCSPSLIECMRFLLNSKDILSGLALTLLDKKLSRSRKINLLLGQILSTIPYGKAAVNAIQARRASSRPGS